MKAFSCDRKISARANKRFCVWIHIAAKTSACQICLKYTDSSILMDLQREIYLRSETACGTSQQHGGGGGGCGLGDLGGGCYSANLYLPGKKLVDVLVLVYRQTLHDIGKCNIYKTDIHDVYLLNDCRS